MFRTSRGPWGVVHQCRDRVTGALYAAKSIAKQVKWLIKEVDQIVRLCISASFLQGSSDQPFPAQKVALLKYLNHPNVVRYTVLKIAPQSQAHFQAEFLSLSLSVGQVRVKEVFEEDDCWYLVQELVSGGRVVDQ